MDSSCMRSQNELGDEKFNTPYHAMLAEAIHQANQIEFIIDDILAAEHLRLQNGEMSAQPYFDFILKELQGKTLNRKCELLFENPHVLQLLTDSYNEVEVTQQLFSEWRKLRNRFTHGLIVWNSSSIPVLYHKGYCYDIESHVAKFFQLNGQIIAIMSVLEGLKSDYKGMPVFLDDKCDPDHPIYG
ncbi:MAG: hypothetical protein HFJ74_03210 [Eggerthellaceae bacterium]|jgi:hypothetical protein|nr:hypothetical protein [Eggerthellaceae bacterium]